MLKFLVVLQVVGMLSMILSLVYIIKKRVDNTYDNLIYLIFAVLIQNVGYFQLIHSGEFAVSLQALKIEYLGTAVIPFLYMMFVMDYLDKKYPRPLMILQILISCIVLLSTWNCEKVSFYYTSIEFVKTGMFSHLVLGKGIGYLIMLLNVVWSYSISLYLGIRAFAEKHISVKRKKVLGALTVTSCLPVVALLCIVTGLTSSYDFTPMADMVVVVILVLYSEKEKVFDIVSSAKERVFDIVDDAIIIVNEKYDILQCNAGAEKLFHEFQDNYHYSPYERREKIRSLFETEENQEFSMGGRGFQVHTYRFWDEEENMNGGLALMLDITKQKNDMKQLVKLKEESDSANRAKSSFLANMSHEIRTPMNAIVGMSDLIMEESFGRKVYSYACEIKNASNNLLRIIDDILDISKMELGNMELHLSKYSLSKLLDELYQLMKIPAKNKGLKLIFHMDDTIPDGLYGDEKRVRQILFNILNNALKFTKEGKVEFSIKAQKLEENKIRIACRVVDTGIGMKKEQIEQLFENFHQANDGINRNNGGVGLGLAISKRFANMMDGDIFVESEYGLGSAFTVEIVQEIKDARKIADVKKMEKKTISEPSFFAPEAGALIVDDNKVNLKIAQKLLESYQLQVELAVSGLESIEKVKSRKYDVIFMDHMMPEMDGVEAAHCIRTETGENGKEVPIVALTANVSEETREMFINNGFQGFLAKPINKAELDRILGKVIPEDKKHKKKNLESGKENPLEEKKDSRKKTEKQEEDKNFLIMERVKKLDDIEESVVSERFGKMAGDYVELLDIYLQEGREKIEEIRKKAEQNEFVDYGILVHGLKSASANIGAIHLSKHALHHEMAVKNGGFSNIRDDVSDLIEEYARLLNLLERIMKIRNIEKTQGKVKISKEELNAKLQKILDQIENFHTKEALESIQEILGRYLLEHEVQEILKKSENKIKLYDDEAAEEMIRDLLKKYF